MAIALVFGMTQCKKNVETVIPTSHGGVYITVRVDNAGKHGVNTNTGEVSFSDGDKLWVGNGGQFVGTLVYNGGQFAGEIGVDDEPPYSSIPLTTEDKLHFYYTAGVDDAPGQIDEGHAYFYYDISNQTGNLPVFSYGHTSTNYNTEINSYVCTLLNKCALVRFNLLDDTSDDVTVYGMCSEVKFTFENVDENVFVPTGKRDPITVNSRGTNNYEKWAILLPQAKVDDASVKIGNTLYLNAVDVPAIVNNALLTAQVSTDTPFEPVFSIDANTRVRFSPGNLQYKANVGYRFAEHQYDIATKNVNEYGNAPYDKTDWVDLFGWGTWGQNQDPLNTCNGSVNYEWESDFVGTLGGYNDWYTLSKEQWEYLLISRSDATNKYASATVNDIHGMILLPDNWTMPNGLTFNAGMVGYNNNEYSASEWDVMESYGAIFLPANGARYGDCDYGYVYDVGGGAAYWTTTSYEDEWGVGAYYMSINGTTSSIYSYGRDYGQSVRLVRDI